MRALLPFLPAHASLGGLSQLAQGCSCQAKLICLESQEFSNSSQQELNTSIPLQSHCIHVMNKIPELFRHVFPLSMSDRSPASPGWESRTSALHLWYPHSSVPGHTPGAPRHCFCVQFLMCRHFQASLLKESSSLNYHCLVECKHCSISYWGRTWNKYGKNKSNIVNRNQV